MFKQVSVSPTAQPRLPKAGIKEAAPSTTVSGKTWNEVKGDYTVIEALDGFVVVLAKDVFGQSWAIKRVKKIDKLECEFMAEVYRKSRLAPFLQECGEDYIVMELIEGQTLFKWVKRVSSLQILLDALRTLRDVILEFEALGIVHGDMHGNNIIVTKDGWRVIDYELSHRGVQRNDGSFCDASLDVIDQIKKVAPAIGAIKYDCSFEGLEDYIEKASAALAPAMTEDTSSLLRNLFI